MRCCWRKPPTPRAHERRLLVVIAADALDAQRLVDEIPYFDPSLAVRPLPDWETLPYDTLSPHQDLVSERLETLYRLSQSSRTIDVLVVPATTALHRLAPTRYVAGHTFFFRQGDTIDVEQLRRQLVSGGYQHVTQVVAPGEFAVRGGLIDLFPMGSALPYRLDLLDAQLETIRAFDPDSQRGLYPVPEVRLLPGREFPIDEAARQALPAALARPHRGRPEPLQRLQGCRQRHRAGRRRVLPAAVLRRDRDAVRLPAARRPPRAARSDRGRDAALLERDQRAPPLPRA